MVQAKVVWGDLLSSQDQVIVNSWNRNIIPWWLLLPQGVSGAIKKAAGRAPFREVAAQGAIPLGGAVVTNAGKLPYQAIIHVAGINLLWRASEYSIRQSVRSSLHLAEQHHFTSLSYPVIGAGSGGVKQEQALAWMQEEFLQITSAIEVTIFRWPGHRALMPLPEKKT